MASRIGILRRKVALGQYELTDHAKQGMEQDGFTIGDVKAGATQRHGRRRRKDVLQGKTAAKRDIGPVCRLTVLRQAADHHRVCGMTMRYDRCEYCGGVVRSRKVTVDLRRGKRLYVFCNVPVGVCSRCGERYYPGPVLERLDEIAAHGMNGGRRVSVPTFDLATAK